MAPNSHEAITLRIFCQSLRQASQTSSGITTSIQQGASTANASSNSRIIDGRIVHDTSASTRDHDDPYSSDSSTGNNDEVRFVLSRVDPRNEIMPYGAPSA